MCGIAGFSFTPETSINAREIARALFSDIQTRGREASGYAFYDNAEQSIASGKSDVCADKFCASRQFRLSAAARNVVLHTRLATKGTVKNPLNNHPVLSYAERGQQVAAVHNGGVWNDDEVFEAEQMVRYGEVDSEAIPAMIAKYGSAAFAKIFTTLDGGIATAWLDERTPTVLHCVRAWDSPMFVAHIDNAVCPLGLTLTGVIFASTVSALTKALTAIGLTWETENVKQYEIGEGEYFSVDGGIWDGLVYPFVLAEKFSRWERKNRNAATQGYGVYGGGVNGWQAQAWGADLDGYDADLGGHAIGSGKVGTGKPSVEGAKDAPLATVTPINSMTDAEWAEAQEHEGFQVWTGTGWASTPSNADKVREAATEFYTSAFDYIDRAAQIQDYVTRRGPVSSEFTPTADDIMLLASLTADEIRQFGFDLTQMAAWQDDHFIHMAECGPDECKYGVVGCSALLVVRDKAGLPTGNAEGLPQHSDKVVSTAVASILDKASDETRQAMQEALARS